VRRTSVAATTAATTAAVQTTTAVTTTVAATTTAAPVSHAPPPATTLTVSATRGDCWVEVRRTSATGEVLFSGVLPQGESRHFASHKLWLRLGAAGNVDLVVDGKQQPVPSGTPELTLPA
jgi:cytoskeletal protein RodZ